MNVKNIKKKLMKKKNKKYEKGRRILTDSVYGQDLSSSLRCYLWETDIKKQSCHLRQSESEGKLSGAVGKAN